MISTPSIPESIDATPARRADDAVTTASLAMPVPRCSTEPALVDCAQASARIKNWPVGTPYQAQSACNNAALALVTLVLLAMPATERTDAALATTTACTLLFILLSGVNHLSHAADASIHKKRFYGAASLAASGGVVLYKWGAF